MANNGVYYSSGNSLNFTTSSTTWATLTSGGTFEISTVSATTYLNLPSGNFTGGTVAGATNFTGGLSANTFSAGTYENLPITGVTSGTGISVTSTGGGGYQITNTDPDQTVTITGGTNIQIVSAYPNFGVNFTGTTNASGDYLPLSGGTVTGGTVFQSGLTANTFYTNYIDFNTSSTPVNNEGRLIWNSADEIGGLEVTMMSGNTVLQIGEENLARVYNADTVTLTAGTVVYVFGSQGNTISVKRASNSGETTSSRALGVVSESIAINGRGFVNTFGLVKNLNTSAYSGGTPIWLGTTPGSWTSTEPDAPNHTVLIGFISRSATSPNGSLFVHINNGWELNELHNVYAPNPTNGNILKYSAATSVWVNSDTINLNGISATTISASTYNNLPGSSSSNCFTTFYVTNISGCSPVNILSPLNLTSGINVTGTTNFTNSVDFSGGLTASTVSATTYQNLPVSAVTNGSGISTSTSNGVVTVTNSQVQGITGKTDGTGISSSISNNVLTITNTGVTSLTAGSGLSGSSTTGAITFINTQVQGITGKTDGTGISSSISNNVLTITNTDLGSSQNIFKNIQVAGVTQFAANSNTSNLNFSGINVTITSAATNTLVFSAGTGGGGGSGTVTSVTLAAGTTGSDVNISNPTITTSGTITLNIPDASATARGLVTTGTQTFAGVKTLTSPSLLGTPTAPTATLGTNTTQIASTQYVKTEIFDTAIPQVSVFGDGGDGALILTSAVTLTDDRFYTNLTISGSGAISTAGYRIFVNGTLDLTNAGANAISNNGGNALNSGFSANNSGQGGLGRTISGFYATTNLLSNSVVNGGIGGAGGASAGANGSVGSTPTALGTSYLTCGGPAGSGGAGSAGNAVSGGAGGSGQAANTNTPANFYYRTLHLGASNLNSMLIKYIYQSFNTQTLTAIPTVGGRHGGGGGGGGGGISVGPAGGSGGGGGGLVVLFAKTVLVGASTNAAAISARGGNGGAGGNGGSQSGAGGGGGGGGGGYVYLVAGSISASATFISTGGGTGGVGGNGDTGKQGGTGGTGGGGGRITVINFSANTISQTDGTTTTGSAGSAGTTPTGGAGGAGASTTYTS